MKIEEHVVYGYDAWGQPMTERIEVRRYNVFERLWHWLTRRRPRLITSIKVTEDEDA